MTIETIVAGLKYTQPRKMNERYTQRIKCTICKAQQISMLFLFCVEDWMRGVWDLFLSMMFTEGVRKEVGWGGVGAGKPKNLCFLSLHVILMPLKV